MGRREHNEIKEKCLQVKDHVEDLGMGERIILKWIKKQGGGVECVHLL